MTRVNVRSIAYIVAAMAVVAGGVTGLWGFLALG